MNSTPSNPPPDLSTRADIETEADVRHLVTQFYGGIVDDDLLGVYFQGLRWDDHLPKMTRFWSSVVFQTGTYRGRPFDVHLGLEGLTARHFARWLHRFQTTVDAHFAGPRAELVKVRAEQIAGVFQVKLGLWAAPAA